jgi:hypothetical protein
VLALGLKSMLGCVWLCWYQESIVGSRSSTKDGVYEVTGAMACGFLTNKPAILYAFHLLARGIKGLVCLCEWV